MERERDDLEGRRWRNASDEGEGCDLMTDQEYCLMKSSNIYYLLHLPCKYITSLFFFI